MDARVCSIAWYEDPLCSENLSLIVAQGYVTHGSDRAIWAFRLQDIGDGDADVIRAWLERFSKEVANLRSSKHGMSHDVKQVLRLGKLGEIGWAEDSRWQEMDRIRGGVMDSGSQLN